jgi:1-acyl-sn-glycerol-3-phosphate acyltransferase
VTAGPAETRRSTSWARAQLNRLIVALALVGVLPLVAVLERLSSGLGRRTAVRCARRVGRLCGVAFSTVGTDRLDDGSSYVFVANHSSPLDIPAVLLADDRVRFLAAAGLFRVPLLASAMRAFGTQPIDRHNTTHAYRQLAALAESSGSGGGGEPLRLAVFAEGGIAPVGERLPFKKGAFVLSIDAGASVVPVAIHGTGDLLPPGARFGLRPGTVVVELLEPLPTAGLTGADVDDLRAQVERLVTARLQAADPNRTWPSTAAADGRRPPLGRLLWHRLRGIRRLPLTSPSSPTDVQPQAGGGRNDRRTSKDDMAKNEPQKSESPSQLIDARIKELGDWRGETLSKLRALIKQADPEVVEEWKWRGTPVWYHDGMICTGETYKSVVKVTFAKGASLKDPAGLFNSSLDGNVRRAIDFHEGEKINEAAFKALVRAAITLNASSSRSR